MRQYLSVQISVAVRRARRLGVALAGAAAVPAYASAQPAAPETPTIRPGEYHAAPIVVDRPGGPLGSGRIVGIDEGTIAESGEPDRSAALRQRIYIEPPANSPVAAGTRYLAVSVGPMLRGVGQVLRPTGIVVVDRVDAGRASEGHVVGEFSRLAVGDRLIPLDPAPTETVRPSAVTGGTPMRVAWIASEAELALPQSYIILDRGSRAGLRPGDQVTVYRPAGRTAGGATLPEADIGVVQVMRVFGDAASARVVSLRHSPIAPGAAARVTAKMP